MIGKNAADSLLPYAIIDETNAAIDQPVDAFSRDAIDQQNSVAKIPIAANDSLRWMT